MFIMRVFTHKIGKTGICLYTDWFTLNICLFPHQTAAFTCSIFLQSIKIVILKFLVGWCGVVCRVSRAEGCVSRGLSLFRCMVNFWRVTVERRVCVLVTATLTSTGDVTGGVKKLEVRLLNLQFFIFSDLGLCVKIISNCRMDMIRNWVNVILESVYPP